MDQASHHLDRSLACYRAMLTLYRSIRENIAAGAPASALQRLFQEMQALDRRARTHDAHFQAGAAEAGTALEDAPAFFEWKTLLAEVQDENREMRRQLLAALAVAKDDLARLGTGRQVLSGYHSDRDTTGQRIRIRSA